MFCLSPKDLHLHAVWIPLKMFLKSFWNHLLYTNKCILLTLEDLDSSLLRVITKVDLSKTKFPHNDHCKSKLPKSLPCFGERPKSPCSMTRWNLSRSWIPWNALTMRGPVFQQLLQNTRNCVFSSSDGMSDLLGSFNKQKSTHQEGWCLCENTETDSE